ncbi:hypothetical protein DdX_20661 [Ditylenchus destructor]|uniref:Uncharacterized protein n=1 Tax=Ditylenchus destructor TaxID=166010 RepID=A0AAD4MGW7_9BILA|nr:hypothetical protein DdX_20661 [Ditylenchus destructor]
MANGEEDMRNSLDSPLDLSIGEHNDENNIQNMTENQNVDKNLDSMNIEEDVFHIHEDMDNLDQAEGEKIDLGDIDQDMGIEDYEDQNPAEFDPHNIESEMTL